MEVRIHSRKVIKPSKPTPNQFKSLKITSFDQIAPKSYGPFVFFYRSSPNTISIFEKLKQLEKTLSELLTLFYPFAGKFNEEQNSIDCNDQGVELFEAEVNLPLLDVIREAGVNGKLINQLVGYDELVWTPAIVGIQATKFNCGGLAIAVSPSHKFSDGFTTFSFIKGWADLCRFGDERVKRLRFDASVALPPRDSIPGFGVPVPDDNLDKLVTKKFVFSATAISNLKRKTTKKPSRVQVVLALIWKTKIETAQGKNGEIRDSVLISPLNFRGKTALQLPQNAAGNFFNNLIFHFKANGKKPELDELVGIVQDVRRKSEAVLRKTETAEEMFSLAAEASREIKEVVMKGAAEVWVCSSCCGFPYYEADFGWGRPEWIASVHKPLEFVLLLDSSDGKGIEAWVTLEPDNMVLFRQNPDIIASVSIARCQL